ncbi:MAG: crotonobetainyl-CoA:carnitine CoA-transferase CaiB-like acyl-CoA transferase [Marivirga sp.]|jgi:crotonobetainyl-CoA:carnitine CoA-transferase CaiB-like acyl-CoA transferase
MQHIFNSLKVVELASVLAGPSVGQFFAELGAQVIKVENPLTRGDVTRGWTLSDELAEGGVSAYFSSVNAGKQSVSLDLKNTEDHANLLALIAAADLLVVSFKPGDAEKLGLSYEQLKDQYPQLIYAEITGYGMDNPKVGYDAVLQAETGFMYINGEPNGPSLKMPVALIDVLAAHQLKEAVLLAYIHRLKSEEGSKVSVSLFDAAVSSLSNQATNFLIAGKNPQKLGTEHPNIAPYGKLYHSADGEEIILAIGNDKQFRTLCAVLGISEIAESLDYKRNEKRVLNRVLLNQKLENAIGKWKSHELLKALVIVKVPAGKLNSVEEVFQLKETQELVLKNAKGEAVGLRNFIGQLSFCSKISHLSPPPPFVADKG